MIDDGVAADELAVAGGQRQLVGAEGENVAVVAGAFALPNVTVPGPLILPHTDVNGPSSVTTAGKRRRRRAT